MIRVLRVIEYEFDDEQTAQNNIDRFTHSYSTGSMRMRSAIISNLDWKGYSIGDSNYEEHPMGPLDPVGEGRYDP